MRVNIYAEEMTQRVEIIRKEIDGHTFTGCRFYLELPVTTNASCVGHGEEPNNVQGPFIHRPGDDDSSAVTFWGKRDLRPLLRKALALLDEHYGGGKWKPQADAIEWDQDEIKRLQKMNEALRAALRCADEEMKAIDDDAVCDHEVGICWCTWIDAREVMRDALAGVTNGERA